MKTLYIGPNTKSMNTECEELMLSVSLEGNSILSVDEESGNADDARGKNGFESSIWDD